MNDPKTVDTAMQTLCGLVIDEDKRGKPIVLGTVLTDKQKRDARAVFAGEHRFYWLGDPRGYGKTTLAAALVVTYMLVILQRGARIDSYAADQGQAKLLRDSILKIVRLTKGLTRTFKVDLWAVSIPDRDIMLEVLASDSASAFGRRPNVSIFDELTVWKRWDLWEPASTSVTKMPDGIGVAITTAGDPTHPSYEVHQQALQDPESWYVSMGHEPSPRMSQKALDFERRRLSESAFKRLWCNEFARVADDECAFDYADVQVCAQLSGYQAPRRGVRYIIGVDYGRKNDATAIAVAHVHDKRNVLGTPERHVVIDRLHRIQGSPESPVTVQQVVALVLKLSREYHRARVVVDPWQMEGAIETLQGQGVNARGQIFTPAFKEESAQLLRALVKAHHLVLPDDKALVDEFLNVRLRPMGSTGAEKIDHLARKGHHDDQVTAVSLCVHELVSLDDVLGDYAVTGPYLVELMRGQSPDIGDRKPEPNSWAAKNARAQWPPLAPDDEVNETLAEMDRVGRFNPFDRDGNFVIHDREAARRLGLGPDEWWSK